MHHHVSLAIVVGILVVEHHNCISLKKRAAIFDLFFFRSLRRTIIDPRYHIRVFCIDAWVYQLQRSAIQFAFSIIEMKHCFFFVIQQKWCFIWIWKSPWTFIFPKSFSFCVQQYLRARSSHLFLHTFSNYFYSSSYCEWFQWTYFLILSITQVQLVYNLFFFIIAIPTVWMNRTSVYNQKLLSHTIDNKPKHIPLLTLSNHHSCFDDPGIWSKHWIVRKKSNGVHLFTWNFIWFISQVSCRCGKIVALRKFDGRWQRMTSALPIKFTRAFSWQVMIRNLEYYSSDLIIHSPFNS